jgi:hypothetical protein
VRIKEALSKHDRKNVCYLVLTLDPSAWTGDGWIAATAKGVPRRPDAKHDHSAIAAAYPALLDRWRSFAQAFRRKWGEFGYVSTVESHRSGWPHLNVVVVSPAFAGEVRATAVELDGWTRKAAGRETARRVLGSMLERTGFGRIAFCESALQLKDDGEDRLAAYISKLAGETGQAWDGEGRGLVDSIEGQMVGEIAKLSQVPHRAPEGFRRLRSSKGFLPPAASASEEITGGIFDENGDAVGRTAADRVIASAYHAEGQAAQQLAGEIAAAIDRELSTVGEEDSQGIIQPARASANLRKLYRATRILDGRDGEQLLLAARQTLGEQEREKLLTRIELELFKDDENRASFREMKKLRGDARFPALRSDSDRAKLKEARECILQGIVEVTGKRRILSPAHACEVTSREQVEAMVRTWGGGVAMNGPAARRYVLRR